MVDYVLRPLAGLLLCGLIGAVLVSVPWFVGRLREIVAELRERTAGDVPPVQDRDVTSSNGADRR